MHHPAEHPFTGRARSALVCSVAVASVHCGNGSGLDGITGPNGGGEQLVDRTFSSYDEFSGLGTSHNGIEIAPSGKLTVSDGVSSFTTKHIWIPNSADKTVSKIDTRSAEVVDTYKLRDGSGQWCWNPSRTTVDLEGNVWVGCRGLKSHMFDEKSGAGVAPEMVDNKVMKISQDDGHVMLSVRVGMAPRALAIDARNHLWIGCSMDDAVWEIDGTTGTCYRGAGADCGGPAIAVDRFPYGAVVDSRGHLWVVHFGAHTLVEIDTATGQKVDTYGPWDRSTCEGGSGTEVYGIAVDQQNNVWLGGWVCSDVVKIKGTPGVNAADGKEYEAGDIIGSYRTGGVNVRGVAVDLDGNIWAANYESNTATKFRNSTGEVVTSLRVGRRPIGVAVDSTGNAWVVNKMGNSVNRINGLDDTLIDEVAVGNAPYAYSDMLGTSLRNITMRPEVYASWRASFDTGVASPKWASLEWSALVPEGASVQALFRCASREAELDIAAWSELMTVPTELECEANAPWGQVELRLYPSADGMAKPVVNNVSVYWRQ